MTAGKHLAVISLLAVLAIAIGCSQDRALSPAAREYEEAPPAGDRMARADEEVATELPPAVPEAKPSRKDHSEAIESAEAAPSEASEAEEKSESSGSAKRHLQSGILTAGSFDDNEHYADYREFVSQALQHDAGEMFPRLAYGNRVMIHVADAEGRAVGDARIAIAHAGDSQNEPQILYATQTGSDGRALVLTGQDGLGGQRRFQVTVTAREGEAVTRMLSLDQAPWKIDLPQARGTLPTRLDLALVMDATGSMGDEMEYLKREIDDIARGVHAMFPNVDQRYALIVYRDQGDQYVVRTYDFTASLSEFRSQLSVQSAGGGGDYPEAMHVALEHAGRLSWRDVETVRVMFLVADAPPHQRHAGQALSAVAALRRQNVRIFPVAASGVRTTAEFVMRAAAFTTLGQYLFLTDHSGIGNPHAAPHVPKYSVEHLNRLMLRMIAQELVGQRMQPQEVLAIERGDQSPPTLPGIVDPSPWEELPVPTDTQQAGSNQVSRGISVRGQRSIDTRSLPVECRVVGRRNVGASFEWLESVPLRFVLFGVVILGLFVFDRTLGREG